MQKYSYFLKPQKYFVFMVALMVQGCAVYHAKPLRDDTGTINDISELIRLEKNQGHLQSINPQDGINMTELAQIVLITSPELKIARNKSRLQEAQAYASGLLPDPQLSISQDKPQDVAAGVVTAWTGGVDFDVSSLINWSSNLQAGKLSIQQAKLALLWSEWQAIQQVQGLALQYFYELEQLNLLNQYNARLTERYAKSQRQLTLGNVTLESNGTDLTAVMDIQSLTFNIRQKHISTTESLCLILSLKPSCSLVGLTKTKIPEIDQTVVTEHIQNIQKIRPDLLALKAGYLAQEKKLKSAVLSQFPRVNLGFNRAKDTGALYTNGFALSISLPIFNRNRGEIAIEKSSRAQLETEYYTRLAQVRSEVAQLTQLEKLLNLTLENMRVHLPSLQKTTDKAERAYLSGNLDPLIYLNLESALLNKRLEEIDLTQQLDLIQLSLSTLLLIPNYLNDPHALIDGQD